MNIGTKSILYGYHQFLLHPLFVFLSWWKLYGFPKDPRLWVAFLVHDLGYWGCLNMDGPEGERHVHLGADIMGWLFDPGYAGRFTRTFHGTHRIAHFFDRVFGNKHLMALNPVALAERELTGWPYHSTWYCFTFYHSRFIAEHYGVQTSRLCAADKHVILLLPAWFQVLLMSATGEIHEYMTGQNGRTPANGCTRLQWVRAMQRKIRDWFDNPAVLDDHE